MIRESDRRGSDSAFGSETSNPQMRTGALSEDPLSFELGLQGIDDIFGPKGSSDDSFSVPLYKRRSYQETGNDADPLGHMHGTWFSDVSNFKFFKRQCSVFQVLTRLK